jgi:hypothetical protein
MAAERIKKENQSLFPNAHLDFSESASMQEVSGFNTVSI